MILLYKCNGADVVNMIKTLLVKLLTLGDVYMSILDQLNCVRLFPRALIPAFLVKAYSKIWVPLLERLFNRSICEGVFQSVWNEAVIIPLQKSGPKSDVSNFRPNFSKVFEKCLIKLVGVGVDSALLDACFQEGSFYGF